MKKRLYMLASCFALLNMSASGQTFVSGGIFANTTWHTANSPYIVIGDIAIYPGDTLNVEAGVVIRFSLNTRMIVRGVLNLFGAQNAMISLTSNDPTPAMGDWKGIELENDQGGRITCNYVHAQYALQFIKVQSSSSGEIINIRNSKISDCDLVINGYENSAMYSIYMENDSLVNNRKGIDYGQNLTVLNCFFSQGQTGIHGWEGPNIQISNSEFSFLTVWPFNMRGIIDNCSVHHNAVGIRVRPELTVTNCNIEYNNVGITVVHSYPFSGFLIHDNKICNNSEYNFKHAYSYPLNLYDNCWCSDDSAYIAGTIYDAYDNIDLGIVTFTPFNLDCIPTALRDGAPDHFGRLFPNPAHDKINSGSIQAFRYEIYSMHGILKLKGYSTHSIDISSLDKGVYFFQRIEEANGSRGIVQKIIKE